jgi:ribonuclease P protein component
LISEIGFEKCCASTRGTPHSGNQFVNFGLTKKHKLLNSLDFSHVFEKSDFKVSTSSSLILAKLTTNSYPRLGLVVSKKNVGCAVARNRVKRLCREVFRLRSSRLPKMDIVVLAKSGITQLENGQIIEMFNSLFDQLTARIEQKDSARR